ncbi:MAG: hypothetical protein R3E50_02955 [Halioglobus sp.]
MTMMIKQSRPAWRYLWLLALIALPALGWLGVLDRFSARDINDSITSAGLIYATARGINALVSVLQGTELDVVFLTFSIGEVLDPVNDLIERFSDVILVALASLALQKILLALVSQSLFNALLTIVAAATALSLMVGRPAQSSVLLRAFLIVVFFRFSLGLVVLANSWVDARFLDAADQQRHAAMERFQGELRQVDTLSRNEDQAATQIADLQQTLARLDAARKAGRTSRDDLQGRIRTAATRLEDLSRKAGGLCRVSHLSPSCPANVKQARVDLAQLESELGAAEDHDAALVESTADARAQLSCLEKHQRGEHCGFWDALAAAPDPAKLRLKLNEINGSLSDFAENCINLLVSLLLKTIAIPLLFIYLLLQVLRVNWSKL